MIPRALKPTLERLAGSFPVITLTGPRQSGKTTLVKSHFPDKPYVSLEDPIERQFAAEDPRGFLARYKDGAIFDEAQRWPDLFSHLQGIVDARRRPGQFVLTGSQEFGLMAGVTQSLAGRAAVVRLLPLSLPELQTNGKLPTSLDELLLVGGYPALHAQIVDPHDWFASYVATYLERDVREVLSVRDLSIFQRFVHLCAGRTGQLLNLSALAGETGISHNTARQWLGVLESSHIVFLLPPYHRNFGKRLVKTPKLYFLDTGLACWLLSIRDSNALALSPSRGALFENWVISEFVKARLNAGRPLDLYFWRDNNGLEADLLLEHAGRFLPIEIKSGQTITPDYIKAARRSTGIAGAASEPAWLIHGGEETYERGGVRCFGWRELGN